MLENAKRIDNEMLKKFKKDFDKDKLARAMQNAASSTNLSTLAYVPTSKVGNTHQFSIDIKTMKATNQKSSGRCWIFAATNVLREMVAKKINSTDFELSQNYLAFYDKLEKINYALESVIDLCDRDHDDRTLAHIIGYPVGDGGQWDMFKSLVKKYGVVPKNVMDETFSSSNTRDSDMLINNMIRKFASIACKLKRENKDEEIRNLKDKYLEDLYRLLVISFGKPVEKFDFEYVDKDGKYHLVKNLTPLKFFEKYIGIDIDDYVSLINSPTLDKPFYSTFTVDYVGNVIGGNDIHYLNLPIEELKDIAIKSLKGGDIVWFGSDCGKFGSREGGLWDPLQYDYELAYGLDVYMDKADMLDYRHSAMNHAMVITGVNLKDDLPTKWKIENSWGTESGIGGYYTATDKWFDSFVYQIVVNKKYLTPEQIKCLDKKPIHLNPWDPMGTLA